MAASTNISQGKCYNCGNCRHPRYKCPAKNAVCINCKKTGHYAKFCLSSKRKPGDSEKHITAALPTLAAIVASSPNCLAKSVIMGTINNSKVKILIDSGSSTSFVNKYIADQLNLKILPSSLEVLMASTTHSMKIEGTCYVNLRIQNREYKNICLSVINNLCSDVIIGHDILENFKTVEIDFDGTEETTLHVCSLSTMNVESPSIFQNLKPDVKPIAVKSQQFSKVDQQFIKLETAKLLQDGIIEPSSSPWRSQVLVTSNPNHKKRMVIDYSQTINKYTELDAYPLPHLTEMINAQYKYFSTFDLKSAYHQVPLNESDKKITAFEASGRLYQFTRLPFGLTNSVSGFQCCMNEIINDENLEGCYAYLDNITICGTSQEEHDKNLDVFYSVAEKYNMTFNDKCTISTETLNIMGYVIHNGTIKPEPERLRPLKELDPPHNLT